MQTFLSLFAVGAIGFWALVLFASIMIVVALEKAEFIFASILSMAVIGLYWKPLAAQEWTLGNIGAAVGLYLLIGIAWSAFKWWKHVRSMAVDFKKKIERERASKGAKFTDSDYGYELGYFKDRIDAGDHKSEICAWIAYWPWAMVWNLTGDLFSNVYEFVSGLYDRISAHALKSVTKI